jgi:predicted nucleic acid-binding protein
VLRLVADTNTVVSALLWHGAPHRLFQAIETEELSLYASRALVDELADVSRADLIVSGDQDLRVLKIYGRSGVLGQ